MNKRRFFALVMTCVMMLSLGGITVMAQDTAVREDKMVATYLPCWGMRPWEVDDIDGDKLTHVYLSFARIDNEFKISDTEVRIQAEGGGPTLPDIVSAQMIIEETWEKVAQLQEKYPHLKFIIAVGGWEAEGFSDMAASAPTREIFVDSVVAYIEKHNLDGIDLDWEFPVNGAWGVIKSMAQDKENFTELIKLLREKLGEEKEISFCANVGGWFLDVIEWEEVVPLVETVNIMAYDMHGTWDTQAFHHAALYPNPDDPVVHWGLTASEAVERLIAAGVPAEKLLLGLPAYGREFRNVEPGEKGDGLFQPFIVDEEGNVVEPKALWRGGTINYKILKDYYINKNGFVRHWDEASKVPYLFDGKTFISYEDEQSIAEKTSYVNEMNLAGVMYWEYVNDIDGELLSAMAKGLNGK